MLLFSKFPKSLVTLLVIICSKYPKSLVTLLVIICLYNLVVTSEFFGKLLTYYKHTWISYFSILYFSYIPLTQTHNSPLKPCVFIQFFPEFFISQNFNWLFADKKNIIFIFWPITPDSFFCNNRNAPKKTLLTMILASKI